jgi:UPF0716 protein FxsA
MGLVLFVIFVAVPLIEIGLFIEIGGAIGLSATLAIVVLTALLGSMLLRYQGLSTLQNAKTSMNQGQIPVDQVVHGLFLLIAGALLLTPGFFTDAIGFALFFPPLRLNLGHRIMAWLAARGEVHVETHFHSDHRSSGDGPTIIEGEVIDEDRAD